MKSLFLSRSNWLSCVVVLACFVPALGDEQAWQIRGDFISLKPGNTGIAIFQLSDKTRIELPLTSLSEEGRKLIREKLASVAEADQESAEVTVRGPLGRSVKLAVPEMLKGVETDAVWCPTAAEAVVVYQLFLAGDAVSPAERTAAEARLAEWRKLAAEKRVRMGEAWVTPQEYADTRRKADETMQHALQLLNLGNGKLAETELGKASKLDPEDGRAEFLLGLAFALSPPNQGGHSAKAIEHFSDAVRRDPDDPYALNNLVVCEVQAGRYNALPGRFRQMLAMLPNGQLIVDNLGAIIANAATSKPRLQDRVLVELNDLYRKVIQELKLMPIEGGVGRKLVLLSPYGKACSAGSATTLSLIVEPPREWVSGCRVGSGFVISEGYVLTSRQVVDDSIDISIEDPTSPGRRLPATEVASLESPTVTLLRCDGLIAPALPLAEKLPAVGAEVLAAGKAGLFSETKLEVARGAVTSAGLPDLDGGNAFHAVAVPRGSGGGPIIDQAGRVVGMVAPTPRTEASGNGRGIGIPIERIWPLIKEQLPRLEPAKGDAPAGEWPVVEGQAGAATVRVLAFEKHVKPKAE
jgi:S1-C subfamily serine protease